MKKIIAIVLAVLLMIAATACAAPKAAPAAEQTAVPQTEAPTVAPTAEPTATPPAKIKIGYISKLLSHPWFQQENYGLEKKCKELGIEYVAIDADLKDENFLAALDNLIAQNINGLAMCITNQGMGPTVAKKCRENNIALITIDDDVKDENGNPVPHVGMPTEEVGYLGGEFLAKLANERGFFKEGNVVKVMQLDSPTVSVIKPRLDGFKKALMATTPLKEEDFIVDATPDTAFENNLPVANAIIQANPQVTHWIITGANDDGALAPLQILREANFPLDNVLACGLGGYEMSLNEFKKGNKSYICIVLQPDVEGAKAVEHLYNKITKNIEMPAFTGVSGSIATVDNYLEFYPNGEIQFK